VHRDGPAPLERGPGLAKTPDRGVAQAEGVGDDFVNRHFGQKNSGKKFSDKNFSDKKFLGKKFFLT
jgi:hypothetical protein